MDGFGRIRDFLMVGLVGLSDNESKGSCTMPNGLKRLIHAIVYQRQHEYIIKKGFTPMKRQWLCIILFAIGIDFWYTALQQYKDIIWDITFKNKSF